MAVSRSAQIINEFVIGAVSDDEALQRLRAPDASKAIRCFAGLDNFVDPMAKLIVNALTEEGYDLEYALALLIAKKSPLFLRWNLTSGAILLLNQLLPVAKSAATHLIPIEISNSCVERAVEHLRVTRPTQESEEERGPFTMTNAHTRSMTAAAAATATRLIEDDDEEDEDVDDVDSESGSDIDSDFVFDYDSDSEPQRLSENIKKRKRGVPPLGEQATEKMEGVSSSDGVDESDDESTVEPPAKRARPLVIEDEVSVDQIAGLPGPIETLILPSYEADRILYQPKRVFVKWNRYVTYNGVYHPLGDFEYTKVPVGRVWLLFDRELLKDLGIEFSGVLLSGRSLPTPLIVGKDKDNLKRFYSVENVMSLGRRYRHEIGDPSELDETALITESDIWKFSSLGFGPKVRRVCYVPALQSHLEPVAMHSRYDKYTHDNKYLLFRIVEMDSCDMTFTEWIREWILYNSPSQLALMGRRLAQFMQTMRDVGFVHFDLGIDFIGVTFDDDYNGAGRLIRNFHLLHTPASRYSFGPDKSGEVGWFPLTPVNMAVPYAKWYDTMTLLAEPESKKGGGGDFRFILQPEIRIYIEIWMNNAKVESLKTLYEPLATSFLVNHPEFDKQFVYKPEFALVILPQFYVTAPRYDWFTGRHYRRNSRVLENAKDYWNIENEIDDPPEPEDFQPSPSALTPTGSPIY